MELGPQIPPDAEEYAQPPLFTETSVPKKLLSNHSTKEGVWGEICVHSGSIKYVVGDGSGGVEILTSGQHGVIAPGQEHHVEIIGPVEFKIHFHRSRKDHP